MPRETIPCKKEIASIEVLMKIVLLLELGLLLGATLPLLVPLLWIGVSSESMLAAVGWHRGYLKAPSSLRLTANTPKT